MAASVVLAKCRKHNRTFGVRVEKRGADWVRTWAFSIDDTKAKREGFDKNKIMGSLDAVPEFPGCPHCGATSFLQCGNCGKMSCFDWGDSGNAPKSTQERKPERKMESKEEIRKSGQSVSDINRCHWCGTDFGEIETAESFSVNSGGY